MQMEIKLYNDIVLKWIFGRQEHLVPLTNFLNSVISYDQNKKSDNKETTTFSDIKILNPYDSSEPFKNEKQGILDIRAKDTQTEEWIDLEVQVIHCDDYAQRSKYYLAGMYRDQLQKSSDRNYDELTACYGIHILVNSYFKRAEKDDGEWFHRYAILNTKTYKPLINHWHLYYVELNKFLKCFPKKDFGKELEQWSYFFGTIQDSSKQLDTFLKDNEAIQEVYEMLQTFTQDDKRREQYRLHEEWNRVQRGQEAKREKLRRDLKKEKKAKLQEQKAKEAALKAKEAALKAKEAALKAKEAALKSKNQEKVAKEAALKAKEAALKSKNQEKVAKEAALKAKEKALQKIEDLQKHLILSLRQQNNSNNEIAKLLDLPLAKIEGIS